MVTRKSTSTRSAASKPTPKPARKTAPKSAPKAARQRTAKAPSKATSKAASKAPARTARKASLHKPTRPPAQAARSRPLDLILLGATGFTGRQAVRAVLRQRPDARWAVAGRDAAKLRALVDERVPAGTRRPKIIVADTRDPESLRAMARQAKVVFNLAGPYHATGDAVVAACIEAGAHYLDLSAETFWMQRLVHEQHDAAQAAGVKIMPCAGYEALPFDLANLWAATQLRQQCGELLHLMFHDRLRRPPLRMLHLIGQRQHLRAAR